MRLQEKGIRRKKKLGEGLRGEESEGARGMRKSRDGGESNEGEKAYNEG
jgi:hypothetical protein